MASPTREETPSFTVAANALAELLEAKLMVATCRGDCQRLKDVLNKEDATTMVVVMATRKQDSPKPALASMNPELLAAACEGNQGELNLFLNRNRTQQGSVAILRSPDDVEEGVNMPAESRASLVDGVTVEGDTVLHVVAANGDDTNFLHCATFIMDLAGHLLFARNYNGDTLLHCAARAKKSKMVTHLIGHLARSQNNKLVKDLLRGENNSQETVLHAAVRNGDNDLVEKLLMDDSELAMFPEKGSTPVYLAILLDMGTIAQTLHDKSLSDDLCYYSGPNGQNALRAAALRSKGTHHLSLLRSN
ncbi:hypothetical protein HU200_066847 [Digitaria exilis]|uniref:Uncharacterized protein n=1 Tax=Digitaria exilis TaxID=1010633 RepID=A0A835DSN5_9POAL|nr:hypothetical protein HU200_066847 [Digitaria exilis]